MARCNRLIVQGLAYALKDTFLLQEVDLQLPLGQLVAVIGPNGAGKSTLLKTVAGVWNPSWGKIFWGNEPLHTLSREAISHIISLVPQYANLSLPFTVYEVVEMGLYSHGHPLTKQERQDRVKKALQTVDALQFLPRRIDTLSMGEQKRVLIARALVSEAPVLFLDEPTTSLDLKHQLEVWGLLQRLAARGTLVVVSAHDFHLVERFADQVVVLDRGRLVAQGAPEELFSQEVVSTIFGVDTAPDVADRRWVLANYTSDKPQSRASSLAMVGKTSSSKT